MISNTIEQLEDLLLKRYYPVLGFNTKQWFIYDSENDVYIDPPKDIIIATNYIDNNYVENFLNEILKDNPKWLNDKDYWYNADDTDI